MVASAGGAITDSFALPAGLVANFTVTATGLAGQSASSTFNTLVAQPTITSDKSSYLPGETVALAGANWTPGSTVHVVVDDDKSNAWTHTADVVATAGGTITDSFVLPTSFVATFTATATGVGGQTATTVFSDAYSGSRVGYIVTFRPGTSSVDAQAALAQTSAHVDAQVAPLRMYMVTFASEAAQRDVSTLTAHGSVERVEADKKRDVADTPNDPQYGDQWSLPKIGWDQAFGVVNPGGSATVAVLDTGISATHPDLAGNVVAGTSILDGSNGESDPNGHGTAMAGIVAARTGNGAGIAGVGYAGVKVMPVTVLGADGTGTDSDVIQGVVWAAENGADVILMAFSNPGYSPSLQAALDYAWDRGLVLVAATGNDGSSTVNYPAGDRGVMGVSATDSSDAVYSGSNTGQDVFIGAPGVSIATTSAGGGYGSVTGTSAAAAEVAGAAALIKANSGVANGVIVSRLAKNADPAGSQSQTGNGRLQLARAVNDTSTASIQPAGADPVGSGGPYVGPYIAAAPSLETYFESTFATVRETFERGDTVYARATGGILNARFYRYGFFDKTGVQKGSLGTCFQGNASPTPGHSYTTLSTDLLSDSASWSAKIWEFNTSANCTAYNAATNLPAPLSSDSEAFEVGQAFAFTSAANRALCVSQTVCLGSTTTFTPSSNVFIRVLGYKQGNSNTNTRWFKPSNALACQNTNGSDRPDADAEWDAGHGVPDSGTGDRRLGVSSPLAAADAGQWRLQLQDGGGGTEELLDLNAFILQANRATRTDSDVFARPGRDRPGHLVRCAGRRRRGPLGRSRLRRER